MTLPMRKQMQKTLSEDGKREYANHKQKFKASPRLKIND